MDFQGTWRHIERGGSIFFKSFVTNQEPPTLEKCRNPHIRGRLSSIILSACGLTTYNIKWVRRNIVVHLMSTPKHDTDKFKALAVIIT
jgi:hypothetical protein